MYATIQIKKTSRAGGNSKSSHILREGEKYEKWIGAERNIVLAKAPIGTFTKAQRATPTRDEKKSEVDRKKELKNINANIATYRKRINGLDEELDRERILKMQRKLDEYYKKRDELKEAKLVEETRGRKQEIEYVEFVFGLTDTPTLDDELNQKFNETLQSFLKKSFFEELQTVTASVHLDQSFLHAHILVKLPENTTWDKYIKNYYKNDGRELYKDISNAWTRHCKKNGLEELIGEEIEEHTTGGKRDYSKYLNKFKEEQDTEAFKERLKKLQNEQMKQLRARESRRNLAEIAKHSENNQNKARKTVLEQKTAQSMPEAKKEPREHLNSDTATKPKRQR